MYSVDGYRALRQGSAVVGRADRGVLSVSGRDRLVWLQGLVTNDVSGLKPGDSCYAAYLTPQGRMISDMRVVELDDSTLLEVPAVLAEALCAKLDSLLFAEDARVADRSASFAVIDVIGPETARVVERALGTMRTLAAQPRVKDDRYGVPGVTFFADAALASEVVDALNSAGAHETTLETLDVVRVEAGRPLFLVDMDEHTIPLEAGIEDDAISFSKGCYVGQEVIVRVLHRGHGRVAKRLVGLRLPKDVPVHAGDSIRGEGRDLGRVTSAVWSPALEQPIALGYVHRDFSDPGSQVTIQTANGPATGTVAALPFVGRTTAV